MISLSPSLAEIARNRSIPGPFSHQPFSAVLSPYGIASDYQPHNYPRNCVVYTGTHDNETLVSWLEDITPAERRQVREYLNNFRDSGKELCQDLICHISKVFSDDLSVSQS